MQLVREVVAYHIEEMRQTDESIPQPTLSCGAVEIYSAAP
jgi:hypothetical protein